MTPEAQSELSQVKHGRLVPSLLRSVAAMGREVHGWAGFADMLEEDADALDAAFTAADAALGEAEAREKRLREAAEKARDLVANYMWNEDDSGNENDLEDAYESLRAILGPSTEQGVATTLAALGDE